MNSREVLWRHRLSDLGDPQISSRSVLGICVTSFDTPLGCKIRHVLVSSGDSSVASFVGGQFARNIPVPAPVNTVCAGRFLPLEDNQVIFGSETGQLFFMHNFEVCVHLSPCPLQSFRS
eukprot:m.95122 g.95122  ORF g.95122 m.95122 type:complete len:119 (-) comp51284_c0_seq1:360-716(-)